MQPLDWADEEAIKVGMQCGFITKITKKKKGLFNKNQTQAIHKSLRKDLNTRKNNYSLAAQAH